MKSNPETPENSEKKMAMRLLWIFLAILLTGGVSAGIALLIPAGGQADTQALPTFTSRSGPLTISVSESGTVKNREQVVLKSEVEGRTTVLSLIAEGKQVEAGDLVIELDSSTLEDQKTAQQITVLHSEAAFISARENLAVVKNQAESDVARAELDFRFAKEDLTKYQKGEYPQLLKEARSKITIAEEELERAIEKLKWSRILREEKYISENELQADDLAWKRSKLDVELSQGELDLLQEYTHTRQIAELESNVVEAERALQRVRLQAAANVVQAEADLEAKDQENQRQQVKLQKITDQIKKCKIHAPVGGMVVYATTGRGRYRGNEEPLEEGQEVRERQELVFLPTANDMMAEIKIHESSLDKVKVDMPVRVTVDAVPGRVYTGAVAKIALLPDAQSSWLNPDLKLYTTEINLDGDALDLRAGMSCRAEIVVEEFQDAIYVPVQSVLRVGGQPTVYLPGVDEEPEPRAVEIGLDNNRMIRIVSGLSVGEEVLLSPPLAPSTLEEGEYAESLSTGGVGTSTLGGKTEGSPSRTSTNSRKERDGGRRGGAEGRVKERGSRKARPNGGDLSSEERRKRWESMSDEDKKKMMEKMREMGGRQGGGAPGGKNRND